jgi:hypothetical protein
MHEAWHKAVAQECIFLAVMEDIIHVDNMFERACLHGLIVIKRNFSDVAKKKLQSYNH